MSGLKRKHMLNRSISIQEKDSFLIQIADSYIKNGNAKSFSQLVLLALEEYLRTRSPQMKVMYDEPKERK